MRGRARALRGVLATLSLTALAHMPLAAQASPLGSSGSDGKTTLPGRNSGGDRPAPSRAIVQAPNIVVILLDDVGFGAVSTFGGPAQTTALDSLAAEGLRYNRFHVTALCSPTRAALLSGRNDHAIGFGTVEEAASDDPGYNMIWPKSAASLADVLRRNGYSTSAFGKWHNTPHGEITPVGPFDRWPTGLGFEYFYGFMGGWDNHWEPSRLYRNTTPVEPPKAAAEGYYLTSDLAGNAIDWVHTQRSLAPDKPYFLYFATGGAHWPHQVPKAWIDKYRGQFDQGWDKLREQIFARQKALGVIPPDAKLTPRPGEITAWDELTPEQKRVSARQMEVWTAFVAYTDHEIGRLIEEVRKAPGGDNTLILYIAGDNGAQEGTNENQLPPAAVKFYREHLDKIGGAKIPGILGSGWALAADTPFQWTKFFASHLGGTRDPLVVSWPARIRDRGGVRSQYTHVVDVAPTLYELAGITFPQTVDGVRQKPLDGVSFAYSFDNAAAASRHRVQVFEQGGNRSIYRDGWLASARHGHLDPKTGALVYPNDFSADRWELYHLDTDYSQAVDVAAQYPARVRAMQRLFETEARRNNILPMRNLEIPPALPARTDNRQEYIFYPSLPRLSATAAPHFYQGSYAISAKIRGVQQQAADGVLLSYGSGMGGFVFYAREGQLVYEANDGARRTIVTSEGQLPAGDVDLACEFERNPELDGKHSDMAVGTVRLYVNGTKVAEQVGVRQYLGFTAVDAGTFGIGRAYGSPVSDNMALPSQFNRTIETVRINLK